MTRILAWHFLPEDRRLRYDDGREVKAGESLSVDVTPVLCERGMHASPRIIDALSFRTGPVLCRVRVSGDVVRGADKVAGRTRECLWMVDAAPALRMFAVDCRARQIAAYRRRGVRIDPRADAAIAAAYGYLAGTVTLAEVRSAYDAAAAAAAAAAYNAADAYARQQERAWQSKRLRYLVGRLRRGLPLLPADPMPAEVTP